MTTLYFVYILWYNLSALFLEVSGEHRTSADGQKFKDDRRPGQDVVPEQEDKMEVSEGGIMEVRRDNGGQEG